MKLMPGQAVGNQALVHNPTLPNMVYIGQVHHNASSDGKTDESHEGERIRSRQRFSELARHLICLVFGSTLIW